MRRVIAVLLLAAGLGCAPACADELPGDPDLGTNLIAATAFDGRLWVLGEPQQEGAQDSTLVSFALADGARRVDIRGAIDLKKAAGHLWVLAASDRPQHLRLLEWKNGSFVTLSDFAVGWRLKPLALAVIGEHPALVASRAVRWFDGRDWHNIALSADAADNMRYGFATAGAPASGQSLYVGFNRGEFGGGLKRIDLATGAMAEVENDAPSNGTYRDTLDASDAIQSIIADPANPDCVVVAIGLIHMDSFGRLVRVCGSAVSLVLNPTRPEKFPAGTFQVEEAFFGLVPAPGGYWAISDRGIYRFSGAAEPERHVLPDRATSWHGLYVNRDMPGVLVLYTELNRHFSVSGLTPLIVPLDQ